MQALPSVIRKSSAHNGHNISVLIACNEPHRSDWGNLCPRDHWARNAPAPWPHLYLGDLKK